MNEMALLKIYANASGAVKAATEGDIVVIVDVIDMSTTAESLLRQHPICILGAAPNEHRAPVDTDPVAIAKYAVIIAKKKNTDVVVISEPRFCSDDERKKRTSHILEVLKSEEMPFHGPYPNAGSEISNIVDTAGKVVIIVSDTGGLAFDAAFQIAGEKVMTATIARVPGLTSHEVISGCVKRISEHAKKMKCNISLVAASSNSTEDVLAVQFLFNKLVEEGFLSI